jgi:hypothetical protein
VAPVSPQDWNQSPDYLYGCDLYNHAYWWEAHEAWEGLWQRTNKREIQGQFLQGLIQVSACHLKLFVGHLDGVIRLLSSSVGYLGAAIDEVGHGKYMGLRVSDFVRRVKAYYDPAGARGMPTRLAHDVSNYPFIHFDLE